VSPVRTAFLVYTELVVRGHPWLLVENRLGAPLRHRTVHADRGSKANLCLIDLESEWVVGEDGYESRSSNSWCAGMTLKGRVLMTLAGGQVAYRLRTFSLGMA
jgi:dihydroorotase